MKKFLRLIFGNHGKNHILEYCLMRRRPVRVRTNADISSDEGVDPYE